VGCEDLKLREEKERDFMREERRDGDNYITEDFSI